MSALGLGLVAACAWGFHDICVRKVSQTVPLMASLLTVLVVALLFQLGLIAASDTVGPLPLNAVVYAVTAGFFFLMASLALYAAFQRGPVRLVAPIIASYPILSVAWAAFQGEAVTALQWGAVLMIVVGVGVVAALADDTTGQIPPKGRTIAYSGIAAIGFAGTFALGQQAAVLGDELSATALTRVIALTILVGGIVILRLPMWPGRKALVVLVLMGLADGIALASVMAAGRLDGAQYAAVAASTFGLLTIVMAWAFLRERMSIFQWMGCAVAFAGIGYLAI